MNFNFALENIALLPALIPLTVAFFLFLIPRQLKAQKVISTISMFMLLGSAVYLLETVYQNGIVAATMGSWPAPYGIIMVADVFSAIMVTIAAVLAVTVLFFSFYALDTGRQKHYFYAFFNLLVAGVCGSFLTGDIFNLFVWFEIMLITSYILMSLGGRPFQLQESFKYMIINMAGAALFLFGVGAIYSLTGTLNMADLAQKIPEVENQGIVTVVAILFLTIFGIKAAIFPLYFWLPRSYFAPPSAITTIFAGLLTKVGVYAIIRVFTLIFIGDVGYTHTIILVIACLTMFLGVIAPVVQMDFKKILSYHIISQVGYMIMGLGFFTPLALAGAIMHIVHNIVVKSCLFLVSGVTEKLTGTTNLKQMGGMLKTHPLVGWAFFIPAMSLAGAPPLSGFFSKFVLIRAGLEVGQYFVVFVSLLVGMLTMFSMIKIFRYVYWRTTPPENPPRKGSFYLKLLPPVVVLILLTAALGLGAQFFFQYCLAAGEQLMNPQIYIDAVLGGVSPR